MKAGRGQRRPCCLTPSPQSLFSVILHSLFVYVPVANNGQQLSTRPAPYRAITPQGPKPGRCVHPLTSSLISSTALTLENPATKLQRIELFLALPGVHLAFRTRLLEPGRLQKNSDGEFQPFGPWSLLSNLQVSSSL